MTKALEADLADCAKLVSLIKEVIRSAHENEVHFGTLKSDATAEALTESFSTIKTQLADVVPVIKQLYNVVHRYDPAPDIQANGIRNWLGSVQRFSAFLLSMTAHSNSKRKSMFFRRAAFAYKLKIHADYLCAMKSCLDIVLRLTTVGSGSLIIDVNLDPAVSIDEVVDLINEMRQIDVAAFCGRTSCFHFCDSAQYVAQGILIAFGSFSAAYGPPSPLQSVIHHASVEGKKATNNVKSVGAGFLSLLSNPDVLSEQILWALANFDLAFVKRFWQLGDNPLLLAGADLLVPSILMSQGINLHSIPINVSTKSGSEIVLESPSAYSGMKPMKARLLSHVLRKGQEYWLNSGASAYSCTQPSDTIVFQVHGGGFICQSARAQEVYLRQLCVDSNVPFFCVDYSLLPDDPFPRAVEEVLYAYSWMLNNFAKLGTTGKRIIGFGDSAGGCLLLSLCIQLNEMNIRCPDSMLLVYPYACSSFSPSPSRMLALADPIVPIPLLVRCCCGYANLTEDEARLVLGIGSSESSIFSPLSPTQSHGSSTTNCCPETPIPSSNSTSRRNSVSSGDPAGPSHHRRCISAPNPLPAMHHSKSGPALMSTTNRAVGSGHVRNKSDVGCWANQLNFRRMRMSESERNTLADLLDLPVFSNPLFSPLVAPDHVLRKLPPLQIIASTGDPLLDDGIALCRKLRELGSTCNVTLVEGVPHGFLNLAVVSRACHDALNKVGQVLNQMVVDTTQLKSEHFSPPHPVAPFVDNTVEKNTYTSMLGSTVNMLSSSLSLFNLNSLKRRIFVAGDEEY